MMMGISEEEETKHQDVVRSQEQPQQRPPLTRQQVIQHLSTLQKRMGQMQSFAKGLSDQAQQDKLKIRTLKQQLEAAKTLQWAKQTTLDAAAARGSPPKASLAPGRPSTSTPRLEQIRRSRQEREAKLRMQFSNSASASDSEHVHTLELEQKLHTLEEEYQTLQDTTHNSEAEKESMLLEHANTLSGKDAIIYELEEEMKGMETLIKDSYHEREALQKRLTKLTETKNSLDDEVAARDEISIELKKRDRELKRQLLEAHDTLELLRSRQLNDSLEALVGHEEQHQLILQLESMVETWEHQADKASRQHPADHANQMQVEQQGWGKDVLDLNSKVGQLKKQIQDQVDVFHNETIEMEVELMDAEEFNRMQTEMLEAQEMELLLLSNALSDLQKDHPLHSKTLSHDGLFAISEFEEGDEDGSHEQPEKSAQYPSHPTQSDPTSKNSIITAEDAEEAELVELARNAYLQTQRCNIYVLSRKFEWQLQRREELEVRLERQIMKYDALIAKNVQMISEATMEEESKKQKEQEEEGDGEKKARASFEKKANEADEEKKSMTRALLRASMSIRELQQELKRTKQQANQLESKLKKMPPPQEENENGEEADPSLLSTLQSRLDEETETNALLKEFMEDLKESHAKEKGDWVSQQQALNKKIEQLSQQLKESQDKSDGAILTPEQSPQSPVPKRFTRQLDDTVHPKNSEEKPANLASAPDTTMEQQLISAITVVRSEMSRLRRTLHSKHQQNESSLGVLSESGSHQSDDYIFCDDKSDEDINNKDEVVTRGSSSNASPPESWYEEFSSLKQELNDLTLELRKSHNHEKKVNFTPPRVDWMKGPDPLPTDPALSDDASVGSSSTSGFEKEILLLREEVDRQQQEQDKAAVSPCLGVSSAGSSPPHLPAAGSSLVSSLEDSSFSENNAFALSEIL